jgi:hypothetical protein
MVWIDTSHTLPNDRHWVDPHFVKFDRTIRYDSPYGHVINILEFSGRSSSSPLPKRMAARRSKGLSKAQRKRSVYILARPIKAAEKLSFLSEGKFPLCHWALLVSSHSVSELHTKTMFNTQYS